MTTIIKKYIDAFSTGKTFDADEAETLFDALITETDEALLADLLNAWHQKGIDEDEIFYLAKIMRQRMKRVNSQHEKFVDIVGTGGSKAKTFNVSTAAALVIAGADIAVAKHGNKAATSLSGSADVLAELGVDPAVMPDVAESLLNTHGICFMFAPNHHRLSPILGKVRRGLGSPTIFNCVGPLCNPASAAHQLIGVWYKELLPKMANALARLGTQHSWIVHSKDGLDEISLSGTTYVAEIKDGKVSTFEISPAEFGLDVIPSDAFRTSSPQESAAVIKRILKGEHLNDPIQNIVLINAAAAICLADQSINFEQAVERSRESIASRKALHKLEILVKETGK